MSISVCMATYNGEKFITQQLDSILEQLTEHDEVIIVDDCSTDSTIETVRRLDDNRITIHINDQNRGEVFSFSKSILLAKNDFLFLADQDDIWVPGRVSVMRQSLIDSKASVVTTNFHWVDIDETQLDIQYDGVVSNDSKKHLKNIIDIFLGKTNYFGCAMAFRRDFLIFISPIPSFVESHDLWIALASNVFGSNAHIDDCTLLKRKHTYNATSTISYRPIYKKLWSRIIFLISIALLFFRYLILRKG